MRGEFVSFDELLSDSLSSSLSNSVRLAVSGDRNLRLDDSSLHAVHTQKRRVCNLQTWLEAWTVYCRVLVDTAPGLASELLHYQGTILEASSNFVVEAWLTYDIRFCMARASLPHAFSWRVIDSNLWQSCMTGKSLVSCNRCRTVHPAPGPVCPFPSGPSPPTGSGGHTRQIIYMHNSKPVCRNYNAGSCESAQCPCARRLLLQRQTPS